MPRFPYTGVFLVHKDLQYSVVFRFWQDFYPASTRILYSTSTRTSISHAIPPGSALVPMAERAGQPASSPNRSTSRLEAPFTTWGCWVKSSALFTKPSTFTKRLILFGLNVCQKVQHAVIGGLLSFLNGQVLS